jgi:hypothetical protein
VSGGTAVDGFIHLSAGDPTVIDGIPTRESRRFEVALFDIF